MNKKKEIELHGICISDYRNLNKDLDCSFLNLYRSFFDGTIIIGSDFINSTYEYFKENLTSTSVDDIISGFDSYFENFTCIWTTLLERNDYVNAEYIWEKTIEIATNWEGQNKKIYKVHKGTAYYFWGYTCILERDYKKGYLLMHKALLEDIESHSRNPLKSNIKPQDLQTSAYRFVTLNIVNDGNLPFGNRWINRQIDFINKYLEKYDNKEFNFKKFIGELSKDINICTFFVYSLAELMDCLKLLDQFCVDESIGETNSINYYSQLFINSSFNFYKLFDLIMKNVFSKHKDLSKRIEVLLKHSERLNNKVNITQSTLQSLNEYKNKHYEKTMISLLHEDEINIDRDKKIGPFKGLTKDLLISYYFRNFAAHDICLEKVILQYKENILEAIFHVIFFLMENQEKLKEISA